MKKLFSSISQLFPKIVCAIVMLSFTSAYGQLGVSITSPTSGQTLTANSNFQITVSTTGSVSKVTYWVDNWTWIGESTSAPYSFTYNFPLSNGTHIIKARVTGTNSATVDAADRSFTIGTTTTDTQAPSIPGGLSAASVSQTSFTLNWTASSDNVGVTGYEVFRNGVSVGTPAANTLNITGLAAGTAYSMTVRARDAAGNWSAQSTALSVTTSSSTTKSISITSPSAGQTIAPNASTSITVSTGGVVSSVTYWVDNWTWIGQVTTAPYTLVWTNNLANGSHIIKARATFSDATTLNATDITFNVGSGGDTQAPTVPSGVAASAISQTGLTLSWSASTDNVGVTGYEVFRNGTSIATPATASYNVSGLTCATSSSFTVRARDAAGNWSAQSAVLTVSTSACSGGDTQSPSVPSNVASSGTTQTSVNISWSASTDNVGVTGYDVYRNGTLLAGTTSTSYGATGLSCATAYTFYVRAKDAAGNQSANSATVNVTTAACSTGSGNMYLGTNFWDPDWSPASDYFVSSPSFTPGSNPWNPTFLSEIGIYKCLRFMDFGHTNNSNVVSWTQRTSATANQADGNARPYGIAYEWMIDLCNRKGADLWVCLPHRTDLNYWTQLATLIRNTLNSNLKVYVEYSNETWNGGFTQFQYTIDQGVAQNLPGGNQYYQGGAYSVWQSVKIFKAFQDVFGAAAMGSRVIRVCSASGNYDIADQAFANILSSSTWNPNAQKVDMFAIAPYVNSGDGAASNVQSAFRAETDATYNDRVLTAETIANKYAMELGCYEGGQHLLSNAQVWSSNPAIYNEYVYMLNRWKPKFKLFNHYTHLGTWNSGGAWGAKQSTSSTLAESHKYRAMVDWVASNPAARPSGVQVVTSSPLIKELPDRKGQSLVFPNPVSGIVNLKLKEGEKAAVSIFDLNGRLLLAKQLTANINQLNLGHLAAGNYLIKITRNSGDIVIEKLVIVK